MKAQVRLPIHARDFAIRSHNMNLFLPYGNNKGSDQPVHPCSPISAFVIHCSDSIIPLASI